MNTSPKTLEQALDSFSPIHLGEMDSIKLMNRIDTKFLTTEQTLVGILEDAARQGYRALETEGTKISSYDSLYYDTPGRQMFLDHHNRRLVRQKVRTRTYVGSGQTFLEIKRKNNHGRTKKKRTEIAAAAFKDFHADASGMALLEKYCAFPADSLSPVLETLFRRITLVNAARTERLTIDTALSFVNHRTGHEASLRDAVIIELKQDGRAASEMRGILLGHRVKPIRVSKYCIGETLTDETVKHNRFKLKIRTIEKVINKKLTTI
ncbi:MAG: polyphosphate polymerase domain-containing protein [Bacteroidales bacterium]|nr:polyphosphate polymerase domain-containing protein [Bacteroidales bacterium]